MKNIAALTLIAACAQTAAFAEESGRGGAMATIHINAPTNIVWDSIRKERDNEHQQLFTRVLSKHGSERMIEQTMPPLPFVGSDTCVLKEVETPSRGSIFLWC